MGVSIGTASLFVMLGVAGCGGGGTGDGGTGGTGGIGGGAGVGEPDFAGFTVAPPPPSDEFKEKESFAGKKARILQSLEAPSVFAGAFMQLSRAYLSGREPANELEADAFQILGNTSQDVRDAISRTLDAVDALPVEESSRLYGAEFVGADAATVLTPAFLAAALNDELAILRARTPDPNTLNLSACIDGERPGLPRGTSCGAGEFDIEGLCNSMCRVSTESLPQPIRSAQYVPFVAEADYQSFETQQQCTAGADGAVRCEAVSPPDCNGSSRGSTCFAVPTVQAGETVFLQGYNFFDVDAKVVLTPRPPSELPVRELDAYVCGDLSAGAEAAPDCMVNDLLSFVVPENMPVARYSVEVVVPNNTGDPKYDHEVYGSTTGLSTILQVVPDSSSSVRFQLRSQEFLSIDETGDGLSFSDEIGIRITTVPSPWERKPGPMDSVDFEFGDVDAGDRFRMDETIYTGRASGGFGFAVVGFEIDNRKAYERAITEFSEVFQLIMESNWAKAAELVGALADKVASIYSSDAVGTAVGEAVTIAFNIIVALWAPADLVIEDYGGVSFLRAVELTSLSFANPPPEQQRSQQGIYVLAEPCEDNADLDRPECNASAKTLLHELGTFASYRERRQYSSFPPEIELPLGLGHSFQITFEYDRSQ